MNAVRLLRQGLVATMFVAGASSGLTQDRRAEQAIKHRRAAFTLMTTYLNRMVQTSEGQRPFDAARMASDARVVEFLSKLPWEGFIDGSERGNTRAREDIWLEDEKFKKYAADMQSQAGEVVRAADSADLKRFQSAVARLRDNCAACHKAYRKD
jgi:cytochrome c556